MLSYRRIMTSCKNLLFLLILALAIPQANAQTIGGHVYGGGEAGQVAGNSEVTIRSGKLGTFSSGGVTTGGNVYGGGNAGDLHGQTTVTLQGGNICGGVFGGAQQANVGKSVMVNIDGAHQRHDLTVNRVYGGNDVSGRIGEELSESDALRIAVPDVNKNLGKTIVDKTFQAYILATEETKTPEDTLNIFIGQMFGGGNGDYDYTSGSAETNPYFGKTAPAVKRTYMQVNGGTYGYVYAGGNAATVEEKAVISVNNKGKLTTATGDLNIEDMTTEEKMMIYDYDAQNNKVDHRLLSMGLNISTYHTGHHFNRIFGGNNKAEMKIMPTWNLMAGSAHDVYSGGNEGNMTSPKGLLLEILAKSNIDIVNIFGGCRKADVCPKDEGGNIVSVVNPEGYNFPNELAARLLVRGGTIRNVYGGNDIAGKVYGGTAVGVYTSVSGDVYGAGNGSYAYTDNADLKDDLIWGDYYYDPTSAATAIDALNAHRPNVEQVSLRLKGEEDKKTIIGGSVYVGGNSCTLVKGLKETPLVELKIGSYVMADNVYLGNNGVNMIDDVVLKRFNGNVTGGTHPDQTYEFSHHVKLTDADTFAKYMKGAASVLMPRVVFDSKANHDPADYENYTTFFGSVFCGGNVGSMITEGTTTINFTKEMVVFNKLVGGCNNANVAAGEYNAAFNGGYLGAADEEESYVDGDGNIKDRLVLNLSGLKLVPLRWKVKEKVPQPSVGDNVTNLFYVDAEDNFIKETDEDAKAVSGRTYYQYDLDANGQPQLQYNVCTNSGEPIIGLKASELALGASTATDENRRLKGANVYGGCYNSGHINGNVVINLNSTIHDRERIFDVVEKQNGEAILDGDGHYNITERKTGVLKHEQGMDVLGAALNVFGGGYGADSEIWGSATVNLKKGYTFQIFGGGENGVIGKKSEKASLPENGNPKYSTYVNLCGTVSGVMEGATGDSPDMAECEFMYGGGFQGPIYGNAVVKLDNGRLFNSFAGSCNADIYGHTETYIGLTGFVYAREHLYGGNDLGGRILGSADFVANISTDDTKSKVYKYDALANPTPAVTNASSYVEYRKGHVLNLFGGAYGDYDYTDRQFSAYTNDDGTAKAGFYFPHLGNAFVNFRPVDENNSYNGVQKVFGAGQGHSQDSHRDVMQDRSYVLVDVPGNITSFRTTSFFGAGAYGGVGMSVPKAVAEASETSLDAVSAVVDLVRGEVKNAYGGSFEQGFTRRTVVNVPSGSTIKIGDVFGGAYGADNKFSCDVYQSKVNYSSSDAQVTGALYGGNNNARRTLYAQVDINVPVWSDKAKGHTATVYGAGKGGNTWAQYTEVNLNDGARVYEAYGGGNAGKVLNVKSLEKYNAGLATEDKLDVTIPGDYEEEGLESSLALESQLSLDKKAGAFGTDTDVHVAEKYNANVHIREGATVLGYCYAGGLGADAVVSGTTYTDLLGGTVVKDLYAGGTSGSIMDKYGDKSFTASANVYVRGGTLRNVYGGGWKGSVGYHDISTTDTEDDILGETNVIIGSLTGTSLTDGIPAVQRNAYGGGEGGAVYGTANLTLYNGYIGYAYNAGGTDDVETTTINEKYEEKINDETWTDHIGLNRLYDSGCVFGGGYIDNSSVDFTTLRMFGGHVRNSLFGGGEIAAIGRGTATEEGSKRILTGLHKAGGTYVKMYDGYVLRNVFAGGRGYNNLGEHGTLYTDGYVFGKAEVDIHGGEIGTEAGLEKGYGNVFGGGDIGYVYSKVGEKNRGGKTDGYYYDEAGKLTEDCKVLIEPWCEVQSAVTIDGTDYAVGTYVPTSKLNKLGNKNESAALWDSLDVKGIIVHNAVFAGGNTSSGSDRVYANAITVFGNATASIHDVFKRDLITIGTGHTGGLYGDGNLTFVDGYRELNITNYGTDYYSIEESISLAAYNALPAREQAYYELRYKCKKACTDKEGKTYKAGSTIATDQLLTLFEGVKDNGVAILTGSTPNPDYWVENGVCSRYAGRIMNTIQRADFCGVFGSRMVMQGAQDRVPEIVDYTNYTINRVGEVSLNKKTVGGTSHGNYFGIYNIVNYLGALTSDVDFHSAVRTTEADVEVNPQYKPNSATETYEQWKTKHVKDRTRNNGSSHNKVALASGVYLELTTEKSTGPSLYEKDWGYITGVIELDLINVQPGIGGGFVYAKNVHGVRSDSGKKQLTLTSLNDGAVAKAAFTYTDHITSENTQQEYETSGNFVHSTQTIIDDCYNISAKYKGTSAVPAHYWFIKGQVYVYDQYISAYTGAANAYSETVNIPLTITAASHGTMKLLNVQPNRYTYYKSGYTPLTEGGKIVLNDVTYEKNQPISYWDYYMLSNTEKNLFVPQTYVTIADCKIGETEYKAGKVMLPTEYESLKTDSVYHIAKGKKVAFTEVFRSSNNISHDKGYILTYNVNNPTYWNNYYTRTNSSDWRTQKIDSVAYAELTEEQKKEYTDGPTYRLKDEITTGGLYGQRSYTVGNLIPERVYDTYQTAKTNHAEAIPKSGQASFEPAWVITKEIETTLKNGNSQHLYPGATVAESDYTPEVWTTMSGSRAEAFLCTSTVQLDRTTYLYANSCLTASQINDYKHDYPAAAAAITESVSSAYYCTADGNYGGNYYASGVNYRALEAWCSMSEKDRQSFTFNYDALDLLVDSTYSGTTGAKHQYDGFSVTPTDENKSQYIYSTVKPVDYTATFDGTTFTYKDASNVDHTITKGDELEREEYEAIPNEQHHYSPIDVKTSEATHYYVVNTEFQNGETPYAVGQTMTSTDYAGLNTEQKAYVTTLDFTGKADGTYYYCRQSYKIGELGAGHEVKDINNATHAVGTTVEQGVILDGINYSYLPNLQKNFTIHGFAPMETSTFYVSRNSDIFDLSKEKIITVIYQYDYEESDVSGTHITPVSERHVLNIHLNFRSGIPEIEDINEPKIVIPGTSVSLRTPAVTPGAYEVTGGGWEIFETQRDAESHSNGLTYVPVSDPLYWYQNDYWVAYYAQTYLGKTYSNHVQVKVANYHDIAEVMEDKEHHYYIDHKNVDRDPKIYIKDYSEEGKNGLDLFKNLFDLSLLNDTKVNTDSKTGLITTVKDTGADSPFKGHALLNEQVKAGKNLVFILHTNVDHPDPWTPIGETNCFEGVLHGDGHSLRGLENSLFQNLCGSVYNLGVMGTFTGAGVAETGDGYVENCWISTTSTAEKTTKPVFGNPSDEDADAKQMVNCYYMEDAGAVNPYTNHTGSHGIPTKKSSQSFYNGEVAYDLNGFYLYKRFCDHEMHAGDKTYKYFTADPATDEFTVHTGYYGKTDQALCSSGYSNLTYVEDRFSDGDFRYAGGDIPEGAVDRMVIEDEKAKFYPLWPDDYIFFGQRLNYGYDDEKVHQDVPTRAEKFDHRLTTAGGNRVYRAPAYFQNSEMRIAHFNPDAYFTKASKDNTHTVHPGMTAIDFTAYNESDYVKGASMAEPYDHIDEGAFYPPLLDDDGLNSFTNVDLTSNLLVYTKTDYTAAIQTDGVVTAYLKEPVFADHYSNDAYRKVAKNTTVSLRGHQVRLDGSYTATTDHYLVDKEDFNAPIAYTFASGKRMWYQRIPETYVDMTKGWEGISIPFSAELVSTQQKGEITHFFNGSTNVDGSTAKIGHEYWLREFKSGGAADPEDANVFVAKFNYPENGSDGDKECSNTFLWDYYYSQSTRKDKNEDIYQQYYQSSRTYDNYGYSTAGKPYIIGFPGATYYEFDLSGEFVPLNTYASISQLDQQVITFASKPEATIAVSDTELASASASATNDGYIFTPNYLSTSIEAEDGYMMKADGSAYLKNATATAAVPFRPYFTAAPAGSRRLNKPEMITFGMGIDDLQSDENTDQTEALNIYAKRGQIVVESHLKTARDIHIVNISGITVAAFTIQPEQVVTTPVHGSGVYIVNGKKVRVRDR